MITDQIQYQRVIYNHISTTNQSFLDMHYYLSDKGIENNKFMLTIYDLDLVGVDPRDPHLNQIYKDKILRECLINFWYFIREIVRIPDQGGEVNSGARYKLHRGNMALNYLFLMNFNIFLELPRQHFKTTSSICWYLWVFNFGTTNSELMFINQKHEKAKANLSELKEIRHNLPDYLRMEEFIDANNKRIKIIDRQETLQHPCNGNRIKTLPGARNKTTANSAGRGCKMPIQWYDEFAFILYNRVIYNAATPAFSTASKNAKRNHAPYGILITTTPGELTTDEGVYAESIKDNATVFDEDFYNYSMDKLVELKDSNINSNFFYIKYHYWQLGSGSEYFEQMVIDLNKDWEAIRREVLLEWSKGSSNCPFSPEDLEVIERFCVKEPLYSIPFGSAGQFRVQVWEKIDFRYPPIMGVDVAGAHCLDSSALTIIDSKTTRVCATFNCNWISSTDLANLIIGIVYNYMPNCIVNIERNGGFGTAVLEILCASPIKRNLYFELKEQSATERMNGVMIKRPTQLVKEYGTTSNHKTRERLIEILHERVNYHKDKFVAPILHSELVTLEVKKNGRTEHSSNAHDDQLFSYLWALYVWYDGQEVMTRFGLKKTELETDQENLKSFITYEDAYKTIQIPTTVNTEVDDIVNQQMEVINSNKSMSFKEFENKQSEENEKALQEVLKNPRSREAYLKQNHLDPEQFNENYNQGLYTISNEFFQNLYNDDPTDVTPPGYAGNLAMHLYNLRNNKQNFG